MIRFGAIGNALVAVPAIRALRRAWPEACLALAGDPLTLELLENCPYLDEFIRYDSTGPEAAGPGYFRFILGLRRRGFTHVIHFKRHLRSELIGFFSGAKVRVGFATEARLQFLTHRVAYREGENVIELNLELARALGIEAHDRRLEYWPSRDSREVEELVSSLVGSGPLVVMHPAGVTQRERLWPRFGELGARLKEELGARLVMIGAPGERGAVEAAAAGSGSGTGLAVGWPLPRAGELLKQADLFVGTDSGPAHLADAAGTPGAVIYAPHRRLDRQLKKWKPGGERFLAFTPDRDCADCERHPRPLEDQQTCAASVSLEQVAAGLRRLYLESGTGGGDNE